jgi:hypothetical protein
VNAVVNVQAYGANGKGTDDTSAIQNALNAVPGGIVFLPPGSYVVKNTLTVPWNKILAGSGPGTQLLFSGTGDAIRMYNPTQASGDFATQADQSGGIRDLMIDGSAATGSATGIHIGDGLGYELANVFIRNFTGSGSIGLHVDNHIWWTEKMRAHHVQTSNCTNHVVFDQTGGTDSLAYSEYDIHMYIEGGQTGLTLQNGVNPYANRIWLTANVQSKSGVNTTFMSITGMDTSNGNYSKIQDSLIFIRAETAAKSDNPKTINFGAGSNVITNCFGEMSFQGVTGGQWAASNAVAGNLTFRGIIDEVTAPGPGLQTAQGTESVTTPLVPASGSPQANTSTANIQVIVSGGNISSIELMQGNYGNFVTTGLTGGTFFLPPGGQIILRYTGTPTPVWRWFRAAT